MRILNTQQMREADRRTIQEIGLSSLVLMENAGRQAVAAVESLYPDLAERRVAVVCGKGNNGGDGFVMVRTLHQRGHDVTAFLVGPAADVTGDARVNLEILGRLGLDVVEIADESAWELHVSEVTAHDLIIDAIVGTGLHDALRGFYQTVVADLNASDIPVVSIDLPTGMSADTCELIGSHDAGDDHIGAPKLPPRLPPAESKWRGRHRGHRYSRQASKPRRTTHRAADPRALARAHRAESRRLAQRRFRTRAGDRRVGGEVRRRRPDRAGRSAIGRGTGHCGIAAVLSADHCRSRR
jgi:hydroxyethylthiazole kinase-like uncharacterized protein yjeF